MSNFKSVLKQRKNIMAVELLASTKKRKFNHEAKPYHLAIQAFYKPGDGRCSSACGEYVINNQYILPRFDRIGVNFERIRPVFEIVGDAAHRMGQLFGLTNRNKARA